MLHSFELSRWRWFFFVRSVPMVLWQIGAQCINGVRWFWASAAAIDTRIFNNFRQQTPATAILHLKLSPFLCHWDSSELDLSTSWSALQFMSMSPPPSAEQIQLESCQRAAQCFVHLQKGAWGRSLPHTFCPFSDLNWAKPSIGFWFRFGFQQTLQNDASFADILTFHISHA